MSNRRFLTLCAIVALLTLAYGLRQASRGIERLQARRAYLEAVAMGEAGAACELDEGLTRDSNGNVVKR